MSEAFLVWMSAGVVLFTGTVNVALAVYTCTLLKGISKLLESNVYLNTEAVDLISYGLNRDYERWREDAFKRAAQRGANHE